MGAGWIIIGLGTYGRFLPSVKRNEMGVQDSKEGRGLMLFCFLEHC
jgi:hypothetical protein